MSSQWKMSRTQSSPRTHLHSSSMNDAMNPNNHAPAVPSTIHSTAASHSHSHSQITNPNSSAVLRNSTYKLSNVSQVSSSPSSSGKVNLNPNNHAGGGSSGYNSHGNGNGHAGGPPNHFHGKPNSSSVLPSFSYPSGTNNNLNNTGARNTISDDNSEENQKEVDYYHNPTELFRWINYQRWDGARARVHSNPEESTIWVISRQNSQNKDSGDHGIGGGRILWRQLPLHLVSMQCGVKFVEGNDKSANDENRDDHNGTSNISKLDQEALGYNTQTLPQIESLIEELLDAHPGAASLKDDQGMLPLHTCLNSCIHFNGGSGTENSSIHLGPNERVLSLLLLANATAVQVRDGYGRTPIEIVQEKLNGMSRHRGDPKLKDYFIQIDKTLRLLRRADNMSVNIKQSMASETQTSIQRVQQQSENERKASQRIIQRLEEELAFEQNRAQREVTSAGEIKETSNILYEELRMVKQDYANMELDLDQARKERDDIIDKNDLLRKEVEKKEHEVSEIQRDVDRQLEEKTQFVATLKSEASTARAMAQGMEAQLRSKFTNEEDLKSAIAQARKEMATMITKSKREKKKLEEDVERLEEELKHMQMFAEELEKKNETLEKRNGDLDKHLGQVLVAYNSLSSEYDQLFDSTNRHEYSLMESIRMERTNMTVTLQKQKKLLEASIAEQEQLMEHASKKEVVLSDMFAQAKKREIEAVGKIKEGFQQIRTQLSAKHCIITEPVTVTNHENVNIFPLERSSSLLASELKGASTSNKTSTGANVKAMPIFSESNQTSRHSPLTNFDHDPVKGGLPVTTPAASVALPHHSTSNSDHKSTSRQELRTDARRTPVRAVEVPTSTPMNNGSSPAFLSLLDRRAQNPSRRPHVPPSTSGNPPDVSQSTSMPSSFQSSFTSIKTHGPQRSATFSHGHTSAPSSFRPSSSSKIGRHQSYASTPGNSNEVMRKQWHTMPNYIGQDGEDSATDGGGYTTSQNSFSLDEFSDMDSKISLGLSSFGDRKANSNESQNQYKGMRSAMKKDLIRVNTGSGTINPS